MPDDSLIRILFKTLANPLGAVYHHGELIVRNHVIAEIRQNRSETFEGDTWDWSECLVLPGFVNAHCHLSLSGLARRIPQGKPFTDWIRAVVQENSILPWKDRVTALHQQAQELLASGVTSLGDYLSHPELLVEYAALPFHQVLYLETLGFQGDQAKERTSKVESVFQDRASAGKHIQLGIAPHAPYSVSPALFSELARLAKHYGCPMSCHVAEIPEEVEFLQSGAGPFADLLKDRGAMDPHWKPPGMSAVRYLDQLGVLAGMQAVHLNEVDEADLDLLAERGTSAVFCPGSTRWLGRDHWMPVRRLMDRGVPVGLGTDSLASNDSLSFLDEIRLAEQMAPELSREEILWMATRGGAEAIGLEVGRVEPGLSADLIAFPFAEKYADWQDVVFDPEVQTAEGVIATGGER